MNTDTSIMATVADVRCTEDFVAMLSGAGMKGVRINSAHVSPEVFRRMVTLIRRVNPGIKILMDTKGPEMRTTALPAPLEVKEGDSLTLCSGREDSEKDLIRIAVDNLEKYVREGASVIMDDGEILLEVVAVEGPMIRCRATNSGVLDSRKTVAFPGMPVPPLPAVSERDRLNIAVAVETGIDMIAHSFVRSASDVEAVRELLAGSHTALYSKIECREALDNLEEIVAASDGILVARGDLGTSIPLQEIPAEQLRAARAARAAGKPLILATQILQSMISRPAPTRAELSDITLAVMEGFDWLLLTGETAQGQYPRECVEILDKTIRNAENNNLRCLIS